MGGKVCGGQQAHKLGSGEVARMHQCGLQVVAYGSESAWGLVGG